MTIPGGTRTGETSSHSQALTHSTNPVSRHIDSIELSKVFQILHENRVDEYNPYGEFAEQCENLTDKQEALLSRFALKLREDDYLAIPAPLTRGREAFNVLVIEDDGYLCHDIGMAVNSIGCSVICVADFDAAVRAAATFPFDLAVVDIRLPPSDLMPEFQCVGGRRAGVQFVAALRSSSPSLKCVAYSHSDDALDISWFEAVEGACFLSKSEPLKTLVLRVEDLLLERDTQLKAVIVHRNDDDSAHALKAYLQNTLGLPKPIVLGEMGFQKMSVIEKFETFAKDADVALVLLTPEDLPDDRGTARQKVIFQCGYFTSYFGRQTGRVLLLHAGYSDVVSELQGVIDIDISDGIDVTGEEIRRGLLHLM